MILAALLDAGASEPALHLAIDRLGLAGEVRLKISRESRGHLTPTRVDVATLGEVRRTYSELVARLTSSGLPEPVVGSALAALERIGAAEAGLHRVAREDLHLHELGGADTLVDLAGAFLLLHELGVDAVYCSPLPAPRGWLGMAADSGPGSPEVAPSHVLPLPAPASMRILAGTGAVLEPSSERRELVTPTGAAILAAVARFERPSLALEAIGYGAGGHPAATNLLSVWIGSTSDEAGVVTTIETNLDDLPGQLLAPLMDDLMAAGALDVTVTPVTMKKGRPGHILAVICEPAAAAALAALILRRTSTLGVRMTRSDRVLAGRELTRVTTRFGPVTVKLKYLEGRMVEINPEFEDCRRLAAAGGVDVRDVIRAAREAVERGTTA